MLGVNSNEGSYHVPIYVHYIALPCCIIGFRQQQMEVGMRSLIPDNEYFSFLDGMREKKGVNIVLAPSELIQEFPNLRSEEAKAICADWRASYHERHVGKPAKRASSRTPSRTG